MNLYVGTNVNNPVSNKRERVPLVDYYYSNVTTQDPESEDFYLINAVPQETYSLTVVPHKIYLLEFRAFNYVIMLDYTARQTNKIFLYSTIVQRASNLDNKQYFQNNTLLYSKFLQRSANDSILTRQIKDISVGSKFLQRTNNLNKISGQFHEVGGQNVTLQRSISLDRQVRKDNPVVITLHRVHFDGEQDRIKWNLRERSPDKTDYTYWVTTNLNMHARENKLINTSKEILNYLYETSSMNYLKTTDIFNPDGIPFLATSELTNYVDDELAYYGTPINTINASYDGEHKQIKLQKIFPIEPYIIAKADILRGTNNNSSKYFYIQDFTNILNTTNYTINDASREIIDRVFLKRE